MATCFDDGPHLTRTARSPNAAAAMPFVSAGFLAWTVVEPRGNVAVSPKLLFYQSFLLLLQQHL